MALAFSQSLFPIQTVSNGCYNRTKLNLVLQTRRTPSNSFRCVAQVAALSDRAVELEKSKHHLLRAAQDTQRGLLATADQRAAIEEALVSSSPPIHFTILH
ncbi:hypothetical protein MRB53_019575 [Persea americana]|uniref:Uncharacterized protein n=1 Tax=Persea americana TaxID=3435 RepID=A0ACC2KYR9_PERAE|nr:hypothetical protein MRB53_019575 [Persea americana]